MKQCARHCLLLVVGEDYSGFGARHAVVRARTDGAVGAGLSGPVGTERNIEEVGQADCLTVSAMAMVGYLKVWRMLLAGMSWRGVSAPSVSTLLLRNAFFSPSPSSLLNSRVQRQLKRIKESLHLKTLNARPSQGRQLI